VTSMLLVVVDVRINHRGIVNARGVRHLRKISNQDTTALKTSSGAAPDFCSRNCAGLDSGQIIRSCNSHVRFGHGGGVSE
jgi:hypothetical protein